MTWRRLLTVVGAIVCGLVAMIGATVAIVCGFEAIHPLLPAGWRGPLSAVMAIPVLIAGSLVAFAAGLYAFLRVVKFPTPYEKPPQCALCGYNLTANVSGVCPECGKAIGR